MAQKLIMKGLSNIGRILGQGEELGNKMLLALTVNKGCHSHQRLQPPPWVSAEGTQDENKEYPISSSQQTAATPEGEPSGCDNTGYWPR